MKLQMRLEPAARGSVQLMPDPTYPIPGFLSSWEPKGQDEVLPEYLNELRDSFFREDENYSESDWASYRSNLDRHFARLNEFLSTTQISIQNLVLGNVQSGKTGHLLANICWARDNEIDLVILLSGNKITLNNQTYKRLIGNLPLNAAHVEKGSTKRGSGYEESVAELQSRIAERIHDRNNPVPVVVLIKRHERIDALSDAIKTLQRRYADSLKVMILDDEADQSSPDNTASKRGPNSRARKVSRASRNTRSTHESIRKLRNSISGRNIYLSYTATPQALLHGELDGVLQPRFCSTVPPGPTYVGIKELVDAQTCLVNVDSCSQVQAVNSADEKSAAALEVAFSDFMVACWLHKAYRAAFHGKAVEAGFDCKQSGLQLLIHPSGKQADHARFYDQVSQIQRDWVADMRSPLNRERFYIEIFDPTFREVLSRSEVTKALITDANREACWQYLMHLLTTPGLLKMLLVNSEGKAKLSNTGEEDAFLPVENDQWQGPEAWILVGGDILGRGLTIPHLSTTLFLRNPQRPNFDTAVQQMRFCGYRKSYLQFLRIYAPGDICEDYVDAVQIDEMARARANVWDKTSRDLILNPPALRFIAPANSRYAPTRNSVITGFIHRANSRSNSGFFGLKYISSPNFLNRNFDLIHDLLSGSAIVESIDTIETELSSIQLANLLENWQVSRNESSDFGLFRELLTYSSDEGGFGDESFFLVIDKEIALSHSLDELVTNSLSDDSVRRDSAKWDKRRRSMVSQLGAPGFGDSVWEKSRPAEFFDDFAILTLVGGAERAIHDARPNQNVIHARLFQLFDQMQTDTGNARISGSSIIGSPKALGITLIGWTPDTDLEYWVHGQASD